VGSFCNFFVPEAAGAVRLALLGRACGRMVIGANIEFLECWGAVLIFMYSDQVDIISHP
jgi:hypothetical protein